jgi:predicted nucleotidyltransferase
MLNTESIKSVLKENEPKLKANYPIKSLAIFGSYARGAQNNNSDIDLLVEFSGPIGLRFINLADELEQILHNKVDLICRNGLPEKFWSNIKNELVYV